MIRDPEILRVLLDAVNRFVRDELVPAENEVAETDENSRAHRARHERAGAFSV